MSTPQQWRSFSRREHKVVCAELGLFCAQPKPPGTACFRHHLTVGVTGICLQCHNEAWAEVGRRFEKEMT